MTVGWGSEVRAALGRGWLGVLASAAALAPTRVTFGSVPVREQRFPFTVSATAARSLSARMQGAAQLGVALVPFTVRGEGLSDVRSATRLDAGAHLGLELRMPALAGRIAPIVELHADYFPRSYAFAVDPLGTIGTSSSLWLGASLGLSFESR